MKYTSLFILGFAIFSCDYKSDTLENKESNTLGNNYSEREPMGNRLTQEEVLGRAKTALLKQNKEIAEKLKVIDHGDYYTVTPKLPPFMIGGGWSVEVNSYSGEILKIYFTE